MIIRVLLPFLFFSCSLSVRAQVVINEVCPANGDINHDPDFFNFSGWVELYNTGASTADVGGYYLSDDPSARSKWRIPFGTTIPSKGYRLIWCDRMDQKLHTNFSIDADGETLVLSNASQVEVERINVPSQYLNISYGRISDGGQVWGYLVNPTPGAKNNPLTGVHQLANPAFSLKAGRYSGTQSLAISHPVNGAQIRYTTDGSEPTAASALYSGPLSITSTRTVKAKAFLNDYLPSKSEVKTFFISEHSFSLPVISISTKPAYLKDNTIGIYVNGTNGVSGNCQDQKVNWNRDWDRHAVFEYFDQSGSKILDHDVDIRIGGACSRNNPQKSLAIKARDQYGKKTIEHDFFETKYAGSFGGFMLRNSGNDFWYTMFRDALMQSLPIGQMDVDYMAYQPATLYINGEYYGIQNLREKIDADYIESNYGVRKDDLDLIESWGYALEGSTQHYNRYLDSLQRVDLSSEEAFAFINRYVDVQEFINYLTAEIYYCNTDWPGNNVKFWRQRSNAGKFRWILWDTDFGFALYTDRSYATHPTLDFATAVNGPDWPNPPWSTLHLRLLLQNPQFRNKLIQTMTTSLSTTFKPERVIGMIDAFQNRIRNEMPYHASRWNISMNNWNGEVERLRSFARERNAFMHSYIPLFFGLQESVRITTQAFPAGSGTVTLNGITSDGPQTEVLYYNGIPFDARPSPAPGYRFSHYEITKRQSTAVPLIERGATWRYFDAGAAPSPDWMALSYADGTWPEGAAELGYGDGDEATVVSYGGNASAKHITTYFRKTFSATDTVSLGTLSGTVLYDDGVVIYFNGEEVYRGNMPDGTVNFSTLALQAMPSETAFHSFSVPRGKIRPGENVMAVEIHQNGPASSDISFNLDLRAYRSGPETTYTSNDPELSDVANSDVVIHAYYEPVTLQEGIVINEFSASNSEYTDPFGDKDDWIELYNNGPAPVDIAGFFVTDNLNQKMKHRIAAGKNGETVINPGAYRLLWADEEITQGALHVNFKLSADGEHIGIYQMVGNTLVTVDEVVYGKQMRNTSFSRLPNATGPFLETAKHTPLAENIFEIPTAIENRTVPVVEIYPNPVTSRFTVASEYPVTELRIYNMSGQLVRAMREVPPSGEIALENEAPGLYSIIFNVNGKTVGRRVMKK